MKKIIILSLLAVISNSLLAGNPSGRDDSLKKYLNKEYFKVNVLVQSEGRYSFEDDDFQGGRTFKVANARLSIKGALENGFFYRLYVNAAPSPKLLDAYVGYKVSDGLSISAGSMKPRQTLDYIPDPASHNFVDRTEMTALLVGSRELGISAFGNIGGFYYYTGLFNGSRQNPNNNNEFYGIGRLQYKITENIPGHIQFAVSGSHGNSAGTVSGGRGPVLRGKRSIAGADLEVKWNRLYFATEYLRGSLETVDLPDKKEVISGYYFTGGLDVTRKTTTFARWQSWSYKEEDREYGKFTLGTNIQFTDIVALVLNIDAYVPDGGDNKYGASFILQVDF